MHSAAFISAMVAGEMPVVPMTMALDFSEARRRWRSEASEWVKSMTTSQSSTAWREAVLQQEGRPGDAGDIDGGAGKGMGGDFQQMGNDEGGIGGGELKDGAPHPAARTRNDDLYHETLLLQCLSLLIARILSAIP